MLKSGTVFYCEQLKIIPELNEMLMTATSDLIFPAMNSF